MTSLLGPEPLAGGADAHLLRGTLELLLTLLLSLIALATGARLRVCARWSVPGSLRLPIDFLVGWWSLAFVALLVGLLGGLHGWLLLGILMAAALSARWRDNGWEWRAVLPLLLPATLLLPLAASPPFLFYDALVYHLGLPWQALIDHRFLPHPETVFSTFPPFVQCVALFPLSFGFGRVPALLHLLVFVAAGVSLGELARRLGAPAWASSLASACLLLLPAHALVPALPAAEGWAVAPLLASAALITAGSTGSPLLVGLLVGMAASSRVQAFPWVFMITAFAWFTARWKIADMLRNVGALALGSSPWWLKNLVLLGQPFLPFGWEGEGVRQALADSGTRLMTSGIGTRLIWDILSSLFAHSAYLGPLILALLFGVLTIRERAYRVMAGITCAGILLWQCMSSLSRYSVYAMAFLLALAAASGRRSASRHVPAISLGCALLMGLVSNLVELSRIDVLQLAVGSLAPCERSGLVNSPLAAFDAARSRVPRSSRVLFVGEMRGFACPSSFVSPSPYDRPIVCDALERTASASAARVWLLDRGYTHLLVNWGELRRLSVGRVVLPWRTAEGQKRWRELVTQLGPPIVSENRVDIMALGPSRPIAP